MYNTKDILEENYSTRCGWFDVWMLGLWSPTIAWMDGWMEFDKKVDISSRIIHSIPACIHMYRNNTEKICKSACNFSMQEAIHQFPNAKDRSTIHLLQAANG